VTSRRARPELLLITGLAGSGKTHVLRALEDCGWFCVDNLPLALIPRFADLLSGSAELRRSAIVVDMREPGFPERFPALHRELKLARTATLSVLFVEAGERTLLRRFSETRRPHPLAVNQPIAEGLREERQALRPIRKLADLILDTSDYSVHELRDWVRERYASRDPRSLVVSVLSFGFRHGVPSEADLVFDVRFLPNPNFVPKLKRLTGQDPPVQRFLARQADTPVLLRKLLDLLAFLLPRYQREGKSYLTIAIGCTGGRHRSVWVASTLARQLAGDERVVKLRHRDLKES